jgi:hypothetical protein
LRDLHPALHSSIAWYQAASPAAPFTPDFPDRRIGGRSVSEDHCGLPRAMLPRKLLPRAVPETGTPKVPLGPVPQARGADPPNPDVVLKSGISAFVSVDLSPRRSVPAPEVWVGREGVGRHRDQEDNRRQNREEPSHCDHSFFRPSQENPHDTGRVPRITERRRPGVHSPLKSACLVQVPDHRTTVQTSSTYLALSTLIANVQRSLSGSSPHEA